jgi:dihydroxyacetone kinase-like predicted kinase
MSLQHSETLLHEHQEGHDCGHDHGSYKKPHSKYGIITVVNGKGLKNTFTEMGVDCIIDGGQTMNPSTEDFVKAVESVNADHIIIIPNNGNVMLSAETAAKYMEDHDITVLPAKTIAQGYASLTMFDANQDLESNVEEMRELISNVKTGEVTYAVRDTEIKGVKIQKGEFIGIAEGNIVTSMKTRLEAVKALLDNLLNEDSEIVTIMYGETVDMKELEEVSLVIDTHYPDVEVEIIEGNQDVYSYIIAVE